MSTPFYDVLACPEYRQLFGYKSQKYEDYSNRQRKSTVRHKLATKFLKNDVIDYFEQSTYVPLILNIAYKK